MVNNEERRKSWTVCTVPCKPMNEKLGDIEKSLREKTPQRTFFTMIIIIFALVGGVIGGGNLYFAVKVSDHVSEIDKNVGIINQAVSNIQSNVNYHIRIDDERHQKQEDKIHQLWMRKFGSQP